DAARRCAPDLFGCGDALRLRRVHSPRDFTGDAAGDYAKQALGEATAQRREGGKAPSLPVLGVRELRLLPRGRDPDDAPRETAPLEPADHPAAGIEFEPPQAVEGRRRKRVMVVVPGLAERQPRQPPHVARLV